MDSSDGATTKGARDFTDTAELLRYLYADLSRLSQVASPDIILHRFNDPSTPLQGIAAAQAHEEALIAATGGTLVMDIESIAANPHFGAVLGFLRGQSPGLDDLVVPFCGLWRFVDGKPIEHWENTAGNSQEIASWLMAERAGNALR